MLARTADVFRPFSETELEVLRGFVAHVQRLAGMRFFDQVPETAAIKASATGLTTTMAEPDDEDFRAAITQFRQVYNHNEPLSFRRALEVMKRSVNERDSQLRSEAMRELQTLESSEKTILRDGFGLAIELNGERQTPRAIIDAYFNGRYLHSDPRKVQRAQLLDAIGPFGRFTLYATVDRVTTRVYWPAAVASGWILSAGSVSS